MSRSLSLRFRLTIWYAFALAAGLMVFAFAVWLSMEHTLHRDLDRSLLEDAQSLENFANIELNEPGVHLSEEVAEYFHAYPRDTLLSIESRSGSVRFVSMTPFPFHFTAGQEPMLQTRNWYGRPYRVLMKTVRVGKESCDVVIASSLYGVERTLARLRLLLIGLVPLIVITACLGGYWLSRRALKPVDEITDRARSIRIGNLSERLIVPRTGDELARLSETLNEMLSRLESAVRSLSRFTADASHELRTPLSIIRATAEIAARKPRSAESYREALNEIVAESERMTQLVDDLLFLARCDAESIEMPMNSLDLSAIVRTVCSQMMPLAEAKTIRLSCVGVSDGVTVRGNDLAIRRLFMVLLDNAVKYSNPGGLVSVALNHQADSVCLEVADTGPGIAEEELNHIFDRFYRTSDARARVQTGSGLGLSLAAGIAHRHEARMEVETQVGSGTRFRVWFRAEGSSRTIRTDADSQFSDVPTLPEAERT
jgi:two-component system, OmpR family, heavy metal sensor histidine kinase CusS